MAGTQKKHYLDKKPRGKPPNCQSTDTKPGQDFQSLSPSQILDKALTAALQHEARRWICLRVLMLSTDWTDARLEANCVTLNYLDFEESKLKLQHYCTVRWREQQRTASRSKEHVRAFLTSSFTMESFFFISLSFGCSLIGPWLLFLGTTWQVVKSKVCFFPSCAK